LVIIEAIDMVDMEHARKLVALEARLKTAVDEVAKVSSELNSLGKDVKISGWDWSKPGDTTSISTQGRLFSEIVDKDSRP
jgi:hypothetical protein